MPMLPLKLWRKPRQCPISCVTTSCKPEPRSSYGSCRATWTKLGDKWWQEVTDGNRDSALCTAMHAIGYGYAAFIHFDTRQGVERLESSSERRQGGVAKPNWQKQKTTEFVPIHMAWVAKMAERRDWRPWQHRIGGMLQSQRIVPSAHLCPSAHGVSFQAMWQMFFDWRHMCSKHIDIERRRRTIMN